MTAILTWVKALFPILLLGIISGCSTTSTSGENSTAAGPVESDDELARASVSQNPNSVDCRPYKPTGSRISKRLCMTVRDWEELREESQQMAEKAKQIPVSAPAGQ